MTEDLKNQNTLHSPAVSRTGQEIKANQPYKFSYPKRKFGKEESSFSPAWYEKWTWLHYDEPEDYVLCIICKNSNDHGMLNNIKVEGLVRKNRVF